MLCAASQGVNKADDALALLLYSIAAAVAESMLAGSGAPSLVSMLELPLIELLPQMTCESPSGDR